MYLHPWAILISKNKHILYAKFFRHVVIHVCIFIKTILSIKNSRINFCHICVYILRFVIKNLKLSHVS